MAVWLFCVTSASIALAQKSTSGPAGRPTGKPTSASGNPSKTTDEKDAKPTGKPDGKPDGKPTKPKVFDFTGLDLAGRLRTPQLMYFLERANEELERANLQKRSFIPSMVRSIDDEAL
jgi:hypothetical protein